MDLIDSSNLVPKILSDVSVFLIISIILILVLLNKRNFYLTCIYPKLSGYFYVPVLGHLGILRHCNVSMAEMGKLFDLGAKQSGRMINVLGLKTIPFTKAEHLEVLFTHKHTQKKGFIYKYMECFLGDSILLSYGKKYKINRKAMSPSMQNEAIGPHAEYVCKHFDALCEEWCMKAGQTFDVMHDIAKITFVMYADSAFGINVDKLDGCNDMVDNIDRFAEMAMYRFNSWIKRIDIFYRFTSDYEVREEALKYADTAFNKIYEERKLIYNKRKNYKPNTETGGYKKFIDYMFDLIDKGHFTEKEMKDECKVVLLAGYDTSASGIAFILLALAMNPEIQEAAYQEIIDVLGDRNPKHSELPTLTYLDKVIKEAFRIFPPIPAILRVNEEEFILDGHIVPKGTQLATWLLETHRSEEYWEDPLEFDPERFSPEGIAKQTKYSYVPFAAGMRSCFGSKVAWITLKCSLVMLLRKFKFFTSYKSLDDVKLAYKITLKAQDGIMLRFEKRK